MNTKPNVVHAAKSGPLKSGAGAESKTNADSCSDVEQGQKRGQGDLDPEAQMGVRWVPGPVSLQLFGWHPCPSNNDGHQGQTGDEEGPQGPVEEPAGSHSQQSQ